MSPCRLLSSVMLVACFVADVPVCADRPEEKHFRERVIPVLQSRCFSCHNNTDRKGDFSLETRDAAFEDGFIEAGKPNDSHLLDVVSPGDGNPPSMPKDGEPLSMDQVNLIREWIAAGASWPDGVEIEEPEVTDLDWWSFRPLVRPQVPEVNDRSVDGSREFQIRTPIDAFILATHAERGLQPSPEADRRTLIRRLYYDLIGLPPTPEEVDAFVNDNRPEAYDALVDQLLKSPHYGERWARHWLDVVKYADTCGYDKDKLRPNAWPYRDYVIRSFNDDKPYSKFVQEQIAGDVLFPGTPDGILGLGFIAAGPWDFIGHVEVSEKKIDGKVARNLDRDEMVSNTLNTFCSVTIQCARCHNHKFDPFTMEHYYSLQAIFAAVDRAERPYDLDPETERKKRELKESLDGLLAARKSLEEEIMKAGGPELVDVRKEIEKLKPLAGPVSKRAEFGYHSGIVKSANTEKWVEVDLGQQVAVSKIILHPCHDEYAGIGAGFGFPVRYRVEVGGNSADFDKQNKGASGNVRRVVLDRTNLDSPNPGLMPIEIETTEESVRIVRVSATKLAERKNDYIFALAEIEVLDEAGNSVALNATVRSKDSIEAPVRWGRKNLTDGIWAKAGNPEAIEDLAEARKKESAILAEINTPNRIDRGEKLDQQIAERRKTLGALPVGKMVYAAATHFTKRGNFQPTEGRPRTIHVLHRGNVQQPGEVVAPGTIPVVLNAERSLNLQEGQTEGERRAALARWLTREDHPLTWRSIVNRVWQYHFGTGLVESPNDFGRMGVMPTQPELLDWLAVEFRDNGQSIKSLHRLIVRSSVYRQASMANARNEQLDSSNQYLWKANRRRLSAEEIRDSILSVSGKLDRKMGGPGFYLFELEKTAHSPHYEYHKFDPEDAASHRRSVYRFIVRSQPDPFMTTLDCADSSQSTPQRTETLTSLQALSLLNNRFNLAMAKHFAERLQAEADGTEEQVELAVRLVSGRRPSAEERNELVQYATAHGLPNLCRVLFNLSEFVYLD